MFILSEYPPEAQKWFKSAPVFWISAVSTAIEGGVTNRDDLADLAFFMHHKERMSRGRGSPLKKSEPRFDALVKEWQGFRTLVSPLIKGKGKSKPTTTLRTSRIKTVGAWCGSSSLANPARDVDFAIEHNINRLDIIINDHSKSRNPRKFTARNHKKIMALCKRAQDNDIETHLMSWIMPHRAYIDRAAEILVPLCDDVGASSLQWDAEEPWTLANHRMRYSDAAKHIADRFSRLTCKMGVNAIGFTPTAKVGPLAAICDYTVPQAYSTKSSGVKPGSGQKKIFLRYKEKFSRPIQMGLAAFRQSGIPGHTIQSAMTACLNQTNDLKCDTVIYWHLDWIRKNKTVGKMITLIRA